MIHETFSEGTSFLHRADPRAKLVAVTALAIVVAISQEFTPALCGLGLGMLLTLTAGLDSVALVRRLLLVNGFVAFLWVVTPFTHPGEAVFHLGPFTASKEGIRLAALVTIKSNAIVLLFISLAATSTAPALGRAMQWLRLPPKLCFLFMFTLSYIHLLVREYRRLARAARARCFRPRMRLHVYRSYAYLLAMLLVRSRDRAVRTQEAMRLRGFTGTLHSLPATPMRLADAALLTTLLAVALGLAALEISL
jgi:cobalt/nickel transport system permease protein